MNNYTRFNNLCADIVRKRPMPQTRYRQGYNFEKQCEKKFKDAGYTVVSSRGSHSIIDFIAMLNETYILCQCKTTKSIADLGKLFKDENVNLLKDVPVQGLKLLIVKDGTQRKPRVYKWYKYIQGDNPNTLNNEQKEIGQWMETPIIDNIL